MVFHIEAVLASSGGWNADFEAQWSVCQRSIIAKLRGHIPGPDGMAMGRAPSGNHRPGQVVSVGADTSARVWNVSAFLAGN